MEKSISYAGHKVFYRIKGSGKSVVLLHGLAEDGEIWEKQTRFLEGKFQVIVPDLPGSGRSELPGDVSMEKMADSVKAVLEAEAISDAILIGHSMGGYVTLALAEQYPQLLEAFGLFHSTAYADNEEKQLTRKKNIAFIQKHGTYEYLRQSTPTLFSEFFKKDNGDQVDGLIQQYKNFNPDSITAYLEAMRLRPDRTKVLKDFMKPILFVIGRYDNAIPFSDSMELCHLPTLSYIHILERSGHMGMLEETENSNNILGKFLEDLR